MGLFDVDRGDDSGEEEEVLINPPEEEEVTADQGDDSEVQLPGASDDPGNEKDGVTKKDIHDQNKRIIGLLKDIKQELRGEPENELL
ncbi:MAG: hypothetical protein ABEK01_00585 [Candidatus Nanohaloarchaea archaeon]